MTDTLSITPGALDLMREEARNAAPLECCGLLFGQWGQVEHAVAVRNVHPHPATHFEIDPQALIDAHRAAREGGPQILGYYHSHPRGPAAPSATDQEMAHGDGHIWAIIGADQITFWRDEPGGFRGIERV